MHIFRLQESGVHTLFPRAMRRVGLPINLASIDVGALPPSCSQPRGLACNIGYTKSPVALSHFATETIFGLSCGQLLFSFTTRRIQEPVLKRQC